MRVWGGRSRAVSGSAPRRSPPPWRCRSAAWGPPGPGAWRRCAATWARTSRKPVAPVPSDDELVVRLRGLFADDPVPPEVVAAAENSHSWYGVARSDLDAE